MRFLLKNTRAQSLVPHVRTDRALPPGRGGRSPLTVARTAARASADGRARKPRRDLRAAINEAIAIVCISFVSTFGSNASNSRNVFGQQIIVHYQCLRDRT